MILLAVAVWVAIAVQLGPVGATIGTLACLAGGRLAARLG